MQIRETHKNDFDLIWSIFQEIVVLGETYAYPRETTKDEAMHFWVSLPQQTFVCEDDGKIIGTYYLKANQIGRGDHVCNCGYMVSSKARGKGIATAMCEHSQLTAKALGYKAMQFNFVASSNVGAIALWHKLGFKTVGCLPKAFDHPRLGYIDALVLYKWLDSTAI
ncbi:MAG: GNAT family N-acetyltransferase [Epsilonproteobacteria bacterium]|nr:GNAT family N-acetyltransferase [Campylobacterota bacterium]